VHQGAGLVFDPNLDARRFGEVKEDLRGFTLSKLGATAMRPAAENRQGTKSRGVGHWLAASAMRIGFDVSAKLTKRLAMVRTAGPASSMTPDGLPQYKVFFEELARLGYVEGQNLMVFRFSAEVFRDQDVLDAVDVKQRLRRAGWAAADDKHVGLDEFARHISSLSLVALLVVIFRVPSPAPDHSAARHSNTYALPCGR
jgi:hypothetical protein